MNVCPPRRKSKWWGGGGNPKGEPWRWDRIGASYPTGFRWNRWYVLTICRPPRRRNSNRPAERILTLRKSPIVLTTNNTIHEFQCFLGIGGLIQRHSSMVRHLEHNYFTHLKQSANARLSTYHFRRNSARGAARPLSRDWVVFWRVLPIPCIAVQESDFRSASFSSNGLNSANFGVPLSQE